MRKILIPLIAIALLTTCAETQDEFQPQPRYAPSYIDEQGLHLGCPVEGAGEKSEAASPDLKAFFDDIGVTE